MIVRIELVNTIFTVNSISLESSVKQITGPGGGDTLFLFHCIGKLFERAAGNVESFK